MLKTLGLALNRYSPIPTALRKQPAIDVEKDEIEVNLASLYHHYFLDSFNLMPPNPDPAQFEHAQFLLPTPEFRFQGGGLGSAPAIRRHRSNELGQAFCRWFLYENLGVTYFAHVERLLGRQLERPFTGCSLERISSGDTPDYLCASADDSVCLAEAKGRYSSISFKNKEFASWREQFNRVAFNDSSGTTRRLKGHIVATRFATEEGGAKLKSTIYAEDPSSPGIQDFDRETSLGLARAVRAAHFGNIALKLRQPVLASALFSGVQLPEELRVSGVAWRVMIGPLSGKRFIGGYYAVDGVKVRAHKINGRFVYEPPDPLRLDLPGYTFFGLEENVLGQVVDVARSRSTQAQFIDPFQATEFFYSGLSVLRDGSVLAPLEFFVPEEQVTF
jgi:hypothetical protein